MAMILKQSTAVDVLIGPFLDLTDGATAEESETPTVLLSKNGQALAGKSDVTTPVHDDAGYYNCELDATDTNTVGTLVLIVEKSADALPVRHEFQVVEEAIYDALFGASATGLLPANVTQWKGATPADLVDTDKLSASVQHKSSSVGLSTQEATDVNAEADAAIVTYHLDHLLAATYDPASKPGAADALLNELVENDGGVARFTANALEQAPAAEGGLTASEIADAVWDEDITTHTTEDSAGEALAAAAVGGGASAGEIADAVLDEALSGHTSAGTLGKAIADIETAALGTREDTENIQTRLPASLVGGRMDANIGAVNNTTLTGDGDSTPWGPA